MPKGFGKPNVETKSYSVLATWKSFPSQKPDNKRDPQRIILQNVQKSNDCADKRNGILTHNELLILFRAIVTFLFTCTGKLEKIIINTTIHAVVQAIINIEEKNEDNTSELNRIEPATCKNLFKSKTLI